MRLIRVTGLVSMMVLGLSACGDSLKTKAELSKLSYEGFANTVCEAVISSNFEQLKPIIDNKFFKQIERMSKKNKFSEFVDNVDYSEVTLTEKTKNRRNFNLATFGGKAKFRFAIIKKDGFYSVAS
jgi:hypothetical protein